MLYHCGILIDPTRCWECTFYKECQCQKQIQGQISVNVKQHVTYVHMERCDWPWSPNCGVETCKGEVGGCVPLRTCFTLHFINCSFHCTEKIKQIYTPFQIELFQVVKRLASSGKVSSEECQFSNIFSSSFCPCTALPITPRSTVLCLLPNVSWERSDPQGRRGENNEIVMESIWEYIKYCWDTPSFSGATNEPIRLRLVSSWGC